MNRTLLVWALALVLFAGAATTFAYGGNRWGNNGWGRWNSTSSSHGTNTASATFVDANGDGVCDNYPARPRDGSGKWRTR